MNNETTTNPVPSYLQCWACAEHAPEGQVFCPNCQPEEVMSDAVNFSGETDYTPIQTKGRLRIINSDINPPALLEITVDEQDVIRLSTSNWPIGEWDKFASLVKGLKEAMDITEEATKPDEVKTAWTRDSAGKVIIKEGKDIIGLQG